MFDWECGENGCRIANGPSGPAPEIPCELGWHWSYSWGRFVDICAVCPTSEGGGWTTFPAQCRPAACDVDEECPAIAGTPDAWYVCVDGICQDSSVAADAPLDRHTASSLCYAYVTREETASTVPFDDPWQSALDVTCPRDGATCELASFCRPAP